MENLNANIGIVWRQDWIKEFETPWSIFEKLSFANSLKRNDILRELGNSEVKRIRALIGDKWREFTDLDGFDEGFLTQIFNLNVKKNNNENINQIIGPLSEYRHRTRSWFYSHLRWCDKCLANGFHSWFHQFLLVSNYCPYHEDSKLLETCPDCSEQIPFLLSDKSLGDPFTCKCGYSMSNWHETYMQHSSNTLIINNQSVVRWLTRDKVKDKDDKWLLIPQYGSLEIMRSNLPNSSRVFKNIKDSDLNDLLTNCLGEKIFNENKQVFRVIDKYLKNNVLKHHKHCINQFMEMRNIGPIEFPDICPYAYAYVFWRKTILGKSNFYTNALRADDTGWYKYKNSLQFATKFISDELEYLCDHFIRIMKNQKVNLTSLLWILNKLTAQFCLSFFEAWLKIAGDRCVTKNSPIMTEIEQMKQSSFSKFAFSLKETPDTLTIDFYIQELRNRSLSLKYICPNASSSKRIINTMRRCHQPL